MTSFNKSNPTLKDVLDVHKQNIMIDITAQHIGRVIGFNPQAQTVDVKISYDMAIYERVNNKLVEKIVNYPILKNVPLEFSRAGNFRFTMPIKIGDDCIISFNDRDISNWYNGIIGGKTSSPRLHSMSDAVARVGLSNKKTVVQYDADNIHIGTDGTYVKVKENSIELKKGSIHLGETLEELCSQLGDLITAIKAITVTSSSPGNPTSTPLNSAAFTPIETKISEVKTKLSELLQ